MPVWAFWLLIVLLFVDAGFWVGFSQGALTVVIIYFVWFLYKTIFNSSK
jgi:hypothetical protein